MRRRWIHQVSHGKGVKCIPGSGAGLGGGSIRLVMGKGLSVYLHLAKDSGGGSTRLVMGKGFCVFLGDGGGSISLVGGDCD